MDGKVKLQRLQRGGSQSVPVKLSHGQHGFFCYIRIRTTDGLDQIIKAQPATLLKILEPIVADIKSSLGLIPPGHQRLAPHSQTLDWITPQMVIQYFEQSPILQEIAPDVRAVLSGLITGGESQTGPAPQLTADLETIQSFFSFSDLFNPDGSPIRGIQSRIAEALGISNAGTSYRKRIMAVLEALTEKPEEKEELAA